MHDTGLPNNEAWISRFKALRDWAAAHGRLPAEDPEGGPEDTLHTWLERQRLAARAGSLDGNMVTILRMVPGTLPAPKNPAKARDKSRATGTPRLPQGEEGKSGSSVLKRITFSEGGGLPRRDDPDPGTSFYDHLCRTLQPAYAAGALDEETILQLDEAMPGCLVDLRYPRTSGSEAMAA